MDVANELKAEVKPKFIKLHPMSIELVVSTDAKAEDCLKKDSGFMAGMKVACTNHSKTALQKMKGVLTHADKQAAGFTTDAMMAGMFLRPIHMEMEKYFDDGCEGIQKDVGKLLAKSRKEIEALKKSPIKFDLDLKFEGLEIPQKGSEKKVVGGGGLKLPALDVDLAKDVDLTKLRKLIEEADKASNQFDSDLDKLRRAKIELAKTSDKETKEKWTEISEKAAEDVNERIDQHKRVLEEAVEEWKQLSRPLKDADKLIKEWEDDVEGDKSKFPPAAKSAIQSELKKVKVWSLPLTKYRMALSTALKDAGINKKFTEALDSVNAGKAGDSLADTVDDWTKNLKAQLVGFEKELKKSAATLDVSVKKITKLASQKN
jgi:DNA repair exonuclease SbcCD ATPase subunit